MSGPRTHASFPETRWTLMAQLTEPAAQEDALEGLCRGYWTPVYAFLRRQHGPQEAEDLTQEFLLMVLRQELFQRAERGEGRLRSWLLRALELFVSNERRTAGSLKRGGGTPILPLDSPEVKEGLGALASACMTPAEAFDKAWVATLVRRAVDSLAGQYRDTGRGNIFDTLLPWLLQEDDSAPQDAAASACGLSLPNFRVQLHRLRGRYRDELRRQIAYTVDGEDDVQEELRHLFSVSGRQV